MSEAQTAPETRERLTKVEWPRLLQEALTVPGHMGDTYNRFYRYSFLNQILLRLQGVHEPVATYKRWQEMGRQVQKGNKAKAILRPIMVKDVDDQGDEIRALKGFKLVHCLFGLSETEGDELPEVTPPEWNPETALAALDIKEVAFDALDGNVQGYSADRRMAINPLTTDKLGTRFHELGHIVLGHTTGAHHADYVLHRGLKEFQAEAVAYLAMHELEVEEPDLAAERRAYIQGWLSDDTPDDNAIRAVFVATDKILSAGIAT